MLCILDTQMYVQFDNVTLNLELSRFTPKSYFCLNYLFVSQIQIIILIQFKHAIRQFDEVAYSISSQARLVRVDNFVYSETSPEILL